MSELSWIVEIAMQHLAVFGTHGRDLDAVTASLRFLSILRFLIRSRERPFYDKTSRNKT